MTTVADNDPNVEVMPGGVETRLASLSERLAYLEGRLEVAQSLQGIRESFRLTALAIWCLAFVALTGMGAVTAALVTVALRI